MSALQPLNRPLRIVNYALFSLIWATGCAWLALHFFFERDAGLGNVPSAAEPALLRVHGWLAVAAVFFLGWLVPAHMEARWNLRRPRLSGVTLAGCGAVLIISGYALYYTLDQTHKTFSVLHEALGVATIAIAIRHWMFGYRR